MMPIIWSYPILRIERVRSGVTGPIIAVKLSHRVPRVTINRVGSRHAMSAHADPGDLVPVLRGKIHERFAYRGRLVIAENLRRLSAKRATGAFRTAGQTRRCVRRSRAFWVEPRTENFAGS